MKREIFKCKKCGHCCHGAATVSLTDEEVADIRDFLGVSIDELFSFYLIKNGKRTEMKVVDGHCIFFNREGLCSIHPVKPHHCRVWPIHPSILNDENAWLAIKADCKGFLRDATFEEAKELVKRQNSTSPYSN